MEQFAQDVVKTLEIVSVTTNMKKTVQNVMAAALPKLPILLTKNATERIKNELGKRTAAN